MAFVASAAFPVLPGKVERVRNFVQELEPHVTEFERLNKEGTFTLFQVQLQEGPQGDLAIYTFGVEDPSKVRMAFTDSDYDVWWLDFMKDVHGIDLASMSEPPAPPPPVYSWTST